MARMGEGTQLCELLGLRWSETPVDQPFSLEAVSSPLELVVS